MEINKMEAIYPYVDKYIKELKATLSYEDKVYVLSCPTKITIYAVSLEALDRHIQTDMVDSLSYKVHYNRQLLMKLLAHFIAIDATFWSASANDVCEKFIENLNSHTAKVHFTQDEIDGITNILEESKRFV